MHSSDLIEQRGVTGFVLTKLQPLRNAPQRNRKFVSWTYKHVNRVQSYIRLQFAGLRNFAPSHLTRPSTPIGKGSWTDSLKSVFGVTNSYLKESVLIVSSSRLPKSSSRWSCPEELNRRQICMMRTKQHSYAHCFRAFKFKKAFQLQNKTYLNMRTLQRFRMRAPLWCNITWLEEY